MGLSSFFTGRGMTRPVMIINMIGTLFNIPLDYALINGIWIFPEWGIRGAAIATVMSWSLVTIVFALIVFTRKNDRVFKVLSQRAFEAGLFGRLMRYGIPSAVQFSMDIFAFTFFVLMVGRIGKIELAVTNIVLSIDSLAFMPLMGFSLGTSTLVGQALGRNRVDQALAANRATIHIVLFYMFLLVSCLCSSWFFCLFFHVTRMEGQVDFHQGSRVALSQNGSLPTNSGEVLWNTAHRNL